MRNDKKTLFLLLMKRLFHLLLAASVLLSGSIPLHAGRNPLPVKYQLSNPNVSCLARSSDGNLWIGTRLGLFRYNGTSYRECEALAGETVYSLFADADNRLWVGTSAGILLLQDGELVREYPVGMPRVQQIEPLDEKRMILSNSGGLYSLEKETGEVYPIYRDPTLLYNSFHITKDKTFWIRNLANGRLTILDRSGRVLKGFTIPGTNGFHEGAASDMYVCTIRGILRFDKEGNPLPLDPVLESHTAGKNILFLQCDGTALYVGIQEEGIWLFKDGVFSRLWERESLKDTHLVLSLLTPDELWISKGMRGVEYLSRQAGHYSMPVAVSIPQDYLNFFFPLPDGDLLVVTNNGLFRHDLETGNGLALTGNGLEGNDKLGVEVMDKAGHLWIQHNYTEMRCYAIRGNEAVLLSRHPIEMSTSMWAAGGDSIQVLQQDRIITLDAKGNRSEFPIDPHPDFWFCSTLASGQPYFISNDDFYLLEGRRFRKLDTQVTSPGCMWQDADGNFWLGSHRDGLYLFDPDARTVRRIGLDSYLEDSRIQNLVGDAKGNIWGTTQYDVFRISPEGDITIVGNRDQDYYEYNTNSDGVLEDGTVVFGTGHRLFFFNAEAETPEIPLFMEGILVNRERFVPAQGQTIRFNHRDDHLDFYFSGRNFDPGIKVVYQYQLEGQDRTWLNAGSDLHAGYSRLGAGKYTFRVRTLLPDGRTGKEQLVQTIQVMPSPWLSPWAIGLYILFGLSILFLFLWDYARMERTRERLSYAEQEKLLVEQINQERTNFFSNVSHEFRTPLALIYGPIKELTRSESITGADRRLVSILERNADRMVRLTDQLLQFHHSAEDRDRLRMIRTDISVLLRQMLENFEYMFLQKNLSVRLDIPDRLDACCDREKVERIVFNLISNAVKYTPEYGSIVVSGFQEGDLLSIRVADTGIGISPEKSSRIFERFGRLQEKVGDSVPSGYGIGLNYAHHLAEIHKGTLTLAPNEPLGSIFTFSFPTNLDAYPDGSVWETETEMESQPVPEAVDTGQGESILVVEDQPDMREYIRSILDSSYRVTTVGDGEEAWKCIRISAPDLVISDVMMPFKDGYTLCKEIKNDLEYCHLPVVLLTAKANMENQIQGLRLGADAYIGKPFDPKYLLATVRGLMDNRLRIQRILRERTSAPDKDVTEKMNPHDRDFVNKVFALIEEHLSDEAFNVTALSLELGMSRTSLFSKTRSLLGESPQAFLMDFRLNKAMELLKQGDLNVSEVAFHVGFSTLTGFSRSFKNKFGVPPSSVQR